MQVVLPDDSKRQYETSPTVEQLAADIGRRLGKDCVAGRIDGSLVDASAQIPDGGKVEILTAKDPEGLEVIRHSCAHVLGHALKQLWPDAKMAIGPTIDDGFYYDIDMEHQLVPEDLKVLQDRMRKLAKQPYEVVREVVSEEKAREVFTQRNESYKLAIIDDIPQGEVIALYHHQEYIDMCRGPHVTSTRHLKAFELTHLAGAYWRGRSDEKMLQRIYGMAFATEEELREHMRYLEEARRRDHRRLGQQMNLFHFQEEAPGMAFWHPDGLTLLHQIEDYVRNVNAEGGYVEVRTPQLLDMDLWRRSGHAEKFADHMFTTGSEDRQFAVKPMNCPGHCQIFNKDLRSYRQLPLRMSEFGFVHRNEPSGTLHGLLRVRAFEQDDAHVFCTYEQVPQEVDALIRSIYRVYGEFGFDNISVRLATRPQARVGEDEVWDKTEAMLQQCLKDANLEYELAEGEGAFYGPKLEFSLRDSLHRIWQCGTVQLDFSMPELLDVRYVDADSHKCTPVMIHRALLGSLERFTGMLLEEHNGALPLWLAPLQVSVLAITERQHDRVQEIAAQLRAQGLRAEADTRNEKLGYKIRTCMQQRIPYLMVVGERETVEGTVALRRRNEDLGTMALADAIRQLAEESRTKSRISAGLGELEGSGS